MSNIALKFWSDGKDFSAVQYMGERASQEDYSQFRIFPSDLGLLAILADGMGGHTSGEVASNSAVNAFDRAFKSYSADSPISKLSAALESANAELSKLIDKNPSLNGMGCTIIGAYFNPKGLYWISVGDSLIYLYRNRQLVQINQDHSMAPLIEESYRSGKLSKEEAENYPNKNALRSAVMGELIQLIDAPDRAFDLYADDLIILASDGILSLSPKEIGNIIESHLVGSAEKISNELIQAVKNKKRRNQDNTTIQVVKASSLYPKKPYSKSLLPFTLTIFILFTAIFLGGMYSSKIQSWASLVFDSQSKKIEQVTPVTITPDVKKNDLPAIDSPKKSSLGGGLEQTEQHKNEKRSSDSKKPEKKSADEKNSKKSERPAVGSGLKPDSKGGVTSGPTKDSGESPDNEPKSNKDIQENKPSEKKETTRT